MGFQNVYMLQINVGVIHNGVPNILDVNAKKKKVFFRYDSMLKISNGLEVWCFKFTMFRCRKLILVLSIISSDSAKKISKLFWYNAISRIPNDLEAWHFKISIQKLQMVPINIGVLNYFSPQLP